MQPHLIGGTPGRGKQQVPKDMMCSSKVDDEMISYVF